MSTPLQFSEPIEQQVSWIEETTPEAIVEQSLTRLRDGLSARELLRAAALVLVRSTELPASHRGGAIHQDAGANTCRAGTEIYCHHL